MSLHYQISHRPGFVAFDVQGAVCLEDLHGLIDAVAQTTEGSGEKRALVNLLAVSESLKFTDHYSLGEQVVRKLSHLERVASVVPSSRRTGTSEKVANLRGMQLRVFVREDEAVAWLVAQALPADALSGDAASTGRPPAR